MNQTVRILFNPNRPEFGWKTKIWNNGHFNINLLKFEVVFFMQNEVIENYKNNAWANLAGIEFSKTHPLDLFLPYHDKNLNSDGGVVHGGVIATLLHDAGFLAACDAFPEISGSTIDVLDCQVNYIKAAKETALHTTAAVIRKTRVLAFIDAEVIDEKEDVVARAHLVYRVVGENEKREDINQALGIDPVSNAEIEVTPFVDMMNINVKKRHKALSVKGLSNGRCCFDLAADKECLNEYNRISRGAQMLVLDNAAVFSGFTLMTSMKRAATVDLKICFCDRANNEDLIAYGVSLKQQENIVHNQVYLLSAVDKRAIAYGTMTFWS